VSQISNKLKNCRICGSKKLENIIDFGDLSLTGVFLENGSDVKRAPLLFNRCGDCGLVQLGHSYLQSELYGASYGYESHLNQTMVHHLKQKARLLEKKYLINNHKYVVVDIASNDGTLLSGYAKESLIKVGIDPLIDVVSNYYPDNTIKIKNFFSASEYWKYSSDYANLVTSLSVIYDLEDPVDFAQQINEILSEDGIWHFEQSYLPTMVETKSYDTICHEHLLYLSLHDISRILKEAGFKLLEASLNGVNGGSIAITAIKSKQDVTPTPFVQYLINSEIRNGIRNGDAIVNFAKNYQLHTLALKKLLLQYLESGFDVIGFGASTKGNVLLQTSGLNYSHIRAIGEVNTRKLGKQTPGSCIPIVSEKELIESAGNKTLALVLPWHFRETLIKSLETFLSKGGKLLFPLPNIEEVST
jgi:hypothetical protein